MTLTRGSIRENHVTEFEEGRRIAWMPAEPRQQRPGNYGGGNSNRPVRHGPGHLHLRLDRADRQEPLSAGHHRQPTAGPAGPARGPGRRILTVYCARSSLTLHAIRRAARSADPGARDGSGRGHATLSATQRHAVEVADPCGPGCAALLQHAVRAYP
jgi:hypothetical protein